ncbi:MAG: hypothetical protein OEU36_02830 [Gammaproteobacteria bacterium]|nr:hypothetical protein [Gammaproteobacteria bacterium]
MSKATSPDYAAIALLAYRQGLILRGGFYPRPEDKVPPLANGGDCHTMILVGNAGQEMWTRFEQSPESRDGNPHPMNHWSERIITAIAQEIGATVLFPFGGPPYLPFIQWAQRAEAVFSSPIGMLIHPTYGLWHAYRGALALGQRIDLPSHCHTTTPCDSCADKPCLSTCPVSAFSGSGYDVPQCVTHVSSSSGRDCMDGGCIARRACPVGTQYRYEPPQARFHMVAFRAAQHAKR